MLKKIFKSKYDAEQSVILSFNSSVAWESGTDFIMSNEIHGPYINRYKKQVFAGKSLLLNFSSIFLCILFLAACAAHSGDKKAGKEAKPEKNVELTKKQKEKQHRARLTEDAIADPSFGVTSEYFRKTQDSSSKIRLFGNSKREKELEKRLAKLEQRLKGLPERQVDSHGLPVLRRKVVLISLLGDLGLDVLSLLPSALRRTDGIVPVDSSQLAELLKEHGFSPGDLASTAVRREIAAIAGIQAYIFIYFPPGNGPAAKGQRSALRLDVIHATENVLIGSYLATVAQFQKVARKISKDVVRGTEWSCRIVKIDGDHVYLNSGRLTGLQPGDKLTVYGRGKEIIDPITKRSLGFGLGELKGTIEIDQLFATDASRARVLSGAGFNVTDVVKMSELAE